MEERSIRVHHGLLAGPRVHRDIGGLVGHLIVVTIVVVPSSNHESVRCASSLVVVDPELVGARWTSVDELSDDQLTVSDNMHRVPVVFCCCLESCHQTSVFSLVVGRAGTCVGHGSHPEQDGCRLSCREKDDNRATSTWARVASAAAIEEEEVAILTCHCEAHWLVVRGCEELAQGLLDGLVQPPESPSGNCNGGRLPWPQCPYCTWLVADESHK